jgi:predicted ThiF/HesA family dinucleotide-utilizing enzyme
MKNQIEHSPLEEFKEKVTEVLELLNQSNLPIVVEDEVLDVTAGGQTAEATTNVHAAS